MTSIRTLLAVGLSMGVGAGTSLAQTLPYDHVHMAAPDPAKAVSWYREHLGGAPGELPDRVIVDKVLLVWMQRAESPPSEGSVIDHIGFSVPDVDAKVAELQAAGAKGADAAARRRGVVPDGLRRRPVGREARAGAGRRACGPASHPSPPAGPGKGARLVCRPVWR